MNKAELSYIVTYNHKHSLSQSLMLLECKCLGGWFISIAEVFSQVEWIHFTDSLKYTSALCLKYIAYYVY